MNWTETYSQLNPVAQELYKRYASYRDRNMWSQVPTSQSGDSDIDTTQWKADSGANAFYLSPAEYKQYDDWYKQEQAWKKEQEEASKKKKSEEETTTTTETTAKTSSRTPMPQYAPPANFQYNPTTTVAYPTRIPSTSASPSPSSSPSVAPTPPSVYTPQSAVPSNVSYAPLMSVSGADINTQVNSLLAQLAGLLSKTQQTS